MRAALGFRSALRSSSGVESTRTIRNSLLGVLFGFGCGVISAHMLGPRDRGALALLITTVGLSGFLAGLGSSVALRVDLLRDPRVQLRAYAELSVLLAGLQAVLVAAAILALGFAGLVRRNSILLTLTGVLLGLACFAAQQVLDALNAIGWSSGAALLNSLGSLATMVVLLVVWRSNLGLVAAMAAYAAGFSVVALAGWLLHGSHAVGVPAPDPVLRDRRVLVRRGVPLLGLNLGQAIAFRVDHYFVGAFAGVAATGIYSVAAAHVAPSQVASNSIGQVAFREAARANLSNQKLTAMVLAAMGLAIACAAGLWVVAPWFIPAVFGPAFVTSVPLIRVLMVGQIVLAPYLVLSRAFTGRGSALISSGSGLVLFVLLSLSLAVLTPRYGAVGAAWASVLAFAGCSLILALLLKTKIGQPQPAPPVAGACVVPASDVDSHGRRLS